MWANAQRDGRPAEHRWRGAWPYILYAIAPLFLHIWDIWNEQNHAFYFIKYKRNICNDLGGSNPLGI